MDFYLGQICQFPWPSFGLPGQKFFEPDGWALCDGRMLPINGNTALFSLLGDTYGGNGKTTFALPDLRVKNENGEYLKTGEMHNGIPYIQSYISLEGVYPSRS